ncbi:MAG: hypothetical protein ABI995_15940, partial [Acidobacteriota bacterium]
ELDIKHVEKRSWEGEVEDALSGESLEGDEEPTPEDWLEHAVPAASWTLFAGNDHTPEAGEGRAALEAAGIPCELIRNEPDDDGAPPVLELKVPGKFSLQAVSILDKEIFNPQMVADWQAHFESLTDEELRGVNPAQLVAGLLDRAERLQKAYEDERSRRASA